MERDSNRKRHLPHSPPASEVTTTTTAELSSLPAQRWRNGFQEELERRIYFSNLPPRPPPNQNDQPRYKLVIRNHIQSPIFTTDKIDPIQIVIYDTYKQTIVSHSNDSLSSAKLKIVTLNSEFWKDQKESWSRADFNKSILIEREGKAPILTGETGFRLQNGEKIIKNLVVSDNSSWTKSGFRLGVMIEKEDGFRVLEGLSNPFIAKDLRGKVCQKPNELQLTHKVQSLRKIGKERALILENNNIKTVQDFLSFYHTEQAQLREILGIKSEFDKGWLSIVDHAMQCKAEFYNALNCINISPMVSMDEQMIITNQSSHQIQFADPNNNNFDNSRNSSQFGWIHTNYNGEFDTAQLEASRDNMPLVTSNGTHFIGSSSSEPNPFDHNMTIQDQASLFVDSCLVDASNEFGQIAAQGSQFPSNDLQKPNGELNNHMECRPTAHEPTNPHPFRKDSFDPSECENYIQDFIASLSNNVNAFLPRKKVTWVDVQRKRAIIKWVTWPAVQRKRARIEPNVWPTELPSV